MNHLKLPLVLILNAVIGMTCFSQSLTLVDDIPVYEDGKELAFPFAGGLNQPQFSPIDLNSDGKEDLFVFDRSADKALTFLNNGSSGNILYEYAPQYESGFPKMKDWAILRDYNCDGKPDIFTSTPDQNSIDLYKNTSSGMIISFEKVHKALPTRNNNWPIGVSSQDIPELIDVDNDGDLDLLAFDTGGFHVVWFKNLAEVHGCDTLWLEEETACWGEFMEDGLTNTVSLDVACKGVTTSNPSAITGAHAGSTLCAFDVNGDNDMEMLIGDLNYNNLVYLNNNGAPTLAKMDSSEFFYPPSRPVNIELFPAAFWLDVDNDGKKDLISAPNAPNISSNYKQVWYYKNVGTGSNVEFSFVNNSFLNDEMIECGARTYPVFYDYNGDGLKDLIIGNFDYKITSTNLYSGLTVYRNIGTPIEPEFELATRDYLNLSTLFNPTESGVAPAFGDLDNDGDMDMVMGTFNGNIHYFRNEAASPTDSSIFNLLIVKMDGIDVGQNAKPQLVDMNRDGLLDLVIGENQGNLNYYQNEGTKTNPDFPAQPTSNMFGGLDVKAGFTGYSVPFVYRNASGEFELFIGSEQGQIFHYDNISGNLGGNFNLLDSIYGDLDIGARSSVFGADINQDGMLEFAIGTDRGGVGIYSTSLMATSIYPDDVLEKYDFFISQSSGKIHLDFGEKAFRKANIRVFDLQGRVVVNAEVSVGNSTYDISTANFSHGMYMVEVVFDGKERVTKKMIH